MISIFALARDLIDLHVKGHSHLDGVNPSPPAIKRAIGLRFLRIRCLHLVIEVLDNLGNLLPTTALHITVGIGLSTTLVIGIVGLDTITRRPLVETCPTICIIDVTLVLVNLVECHQSLVIDGTRPE